MQIRLMRRKSGGMWETETANGSVPADRGASVSQSGLLLAESGGGEDNSNNNTSVLRSKPRRKYAPCFTCAKTHAIPVAVSELC